MSQEEENINMKQQNIKEMLEEVSKNIRKYKYSKEYDPDQFNLKKGNFI